MKWFNRTVAAGLFLAALTAAAVGANIQYRTGPVDAADTRGVINGLIRDINAGVGGQIFSAPANVPTGTGTTEQFLSTYVLPPNYLARTGQSIRFKATFLFAANTNNRTPKIYFGTTITKTGTVNATSGGSASLECVVTKSGTDTQNSACVGLDGVTNVVQTFPAGTEDDGAGINIQASCTDGTSSAADCVLKTFIVESLQ